MGISNGMKKLLVREGRARSWAENLNAAICPLKSPPSAFLLMFLGNYVIWKVRKEEKREGKRGQGTSREREFRAAKTFPDSPSERVPSPAAPLASSSLRRFVKEIL